VFTGETAMAVDFKRSVRVGDYLYTFERTGNKISVKRRLLNGQVPDLRQPEEIVRPEELPGSLKNDYIILSRGDIPAVA